MAVGDDAVEEAADTLQTTADTVVERGVTEKAAQPVADDAAFVRRRKAPGSGRGPLVVIGGAFALGLFLAKILDWRSHAHPRD